MLINNYYIKITLIFLTLFFVFASCSSDGIRYKVGLSQCANDTQWRKQMTQSIRANAMQRENIDLIITDGENSSSKQIRDIRYLLEQKVDVLIVSPNEADSLSSIIDTVVRECKIPVILVDRRVNSDNYTCFVGASNEEIGRRAADYVNLFNNGRNDILELHGQVGASAAIERSRGFNNGLDKNMNFRHTGNLNCSWSHDIAYKQVKAFWQNGGRCNIIYSHNDDMAIGAWEALNDLEVNTDDIIIIGTDGASSPDGGIQAVIDGKITVTFFYPDGNEDVIELAEALLNKEKIPKIRPLETVQIDKTNAVGLLGQMKMSRKQEQRILRQSSMIKAQLETISSQHFFLFLVGSILALVIGFGIWITKLYRENKKKNTILNEKNAEINAQKEELETQAYSLSQINEKLRISKETTSGSIRYAQTIQRAALPMEQDLNGYFNSFIVYHPKDIVSGDFYWYDREFAGKVETFIFGVIDCTGHGVPGAFMSLIGINLLDQIIKQKKITAPAEILEELNHSVRTSLRQNENDNNDGMEAVLCKIEVTREDDGSKKIMMTYEGAKFPVYHYKKAENTIEIYKTSRRQIGGQFRNIESSISFEDHQVELKGGDRIYMASDGIGDQNNYDRKRYTRKRLVNTLQESVALNMHEQRDFIWNDLQNFKGECVQRDDITVLGIEIV